VKKERVARSQGGSQIFSPLPRNLCEVGGMYREVDSTFSAERGYKVNSAGILNPQINLRSILHVGKHSVPVIFSGFKLTYGHWSLHIK
jgi:hypothetical protein